MSGLADPQAQLLRALVRFGVDHVIVGGVAAQVHGWRGATADLDIAVSSDDGNIERLGNALASVGADVGTPGALGTVFQTQYGRLEIVRRADGIGDYEAWSRRARSLAIGPGLTVVVADPDDVLRSKEAANRDKDLLALPQIRRHFLEAGVITSDDVRGPVAERADVAPTGPPAFITGLLGTRPADQGSARVWDSAAQMILDYRDRWAVTTPDDALGPVPNAAPQVADRQRVSKGLAKARSMMTRRP